MENGPKRSGVPIICLYNGKDLAQEGSTELHFFLDGVSGGKKRSGYQDRGLDVLSSVPLLSCQELSQDPTPLDPTFPLTISIPLSLLSSQAASEAALKYYERLHGRVVQDWSLLVPAAQGEHRR